MDAVRIALLGTKGDAIQWLTNYVRTVTVIFPNVVVKHSSSNTNALNVVQHGKMFGAVPVMIAVHPVTLKLSRRYMRENKDKDILRYGGETWLNDSLSSHPQRQID